MAGKLLEQNKARIQRQIEAACLKCGRSPQDVRLLAVSKGQSATQVSQAMAVGFSVFGENYVQEWIAKAEKLQNESVHWHFIGHLQSNKVKHVVGKVDLIQSVDRESLGQAIGDRAVAMGIRQPILIEVNVAGETSKSGIAPQEAKDLILGLSESAGVRLDGLMIMPPSSKNPEDSRPFFRQACHWMKEWRPSQSIHPWNILSMGTSQDFAVAIEEGSTLIRLGTVLFGPRS